MRVLTFAKRNARELLRDPLTLFFGLGFPLALLFLLFVIQSNIPVALFELERLTPGITVFGLSFLSLFSASTMAKDRKSSFLRRLYTTPMTSGEFLAGYTLPLLPMALGQGLICYLAAVLLGLELRLGILYALVFLLPVSLLYVALGLLCGSLLNDKQVGGICGALLTNVSAWLSGIWFDTELMGGAFQRIAEALPFVHAVEMERALLAEDFSAALPHLWWVLGYAAAVFALAVYCFLGQSKRQ